MSGCIRKTTGFTGLPIAKNPQKTLRALYAKTKEVLKKMPADAGYRQNTEQIITLRNKIANSTDNIADIEKKMNSGIIEELIVQAENELFLARKMLIWKPWEPLMRKSPPKQWEWPPARSDTNVENTDDANKCN